MTLMDEVRERSVSQKQREQDEAIAERVQKEANRLSSIKFGQDRAIKEIPEIAQSILKAVDAGKSHVYVTIQRWSRDYGLSESQSSFLSTLRDHFKEEGFRTEVQKDETKPCGSDPMFEHTVYDTDLKIYW